MAYRGEVYAMAIIAMAIAYFVSVRYRRGLRQVPGPFFASILPFDRIRTAASGEQFRHHIKYHEQYGPLVRIGPNHVSIGDANLIPQIYGITSRFYKTMFYSLFDARSKDNHSFPTVFSIRDEDGHKSLKRPVANAYSMSSLVELEPLVDQCSAILQKKLDGMVDKPFDLGVWVQWYAFDVISSITFSQRLGFMENEEDVHGIINAIEGRLAYNAVIGQAPALHQYLLGNSFVSAIANKIPSLARLNSAAYIVSFAAAQLSRYQGKDKASFAYKDMLARFKRTRDGESVMTDTELLSHASSNIFAGSDTTAISLRAIIYYLCHNPRCYEKVMDEITTADKNGKLSNPVRFKEALELQFFNACIKEALRLHPAVGLLLERTVPEEGADILGVRMTPGTIVGINPWVVSRDQAVYGADADAFRPERWMEATPEQLKLMDRNFLAFGYGARTCLGKNISLLEMTKLLPQLLRAYTITLVDPEVEWELHDFWFVKQTGLITTVTPRVVTT